MKEKYEAPIITKNAFVSHELMRNIQKIMDDGYGIGVGFEDKEYSRDTFIGIHKISMTYISKNLPVTYKWIDERYNVNQELIDIFALIMKSYPDGTEDLFFDIYQYIKKEGPIKSIFLD